MNKWVKKNIDLANSKAYLDNLFDVYPVELGMSREISSGLKVNIKKILKNKNKVGLLEELLKLAKFPIDDPYIASLRRHKFLLNKNPRTVERLWERLSLMGFKRILKLIAQPKSPSRQFGNTFKNWLTTLKYPILSSREFLNAKNKIVFLKGSDKQLKQFAVDVLGLKRLSRSPDFIIKIKNRFIIGEAKFLTDYGGTQNNQFDGALKMTKIKKAKVLGIAVLDGIVWFKSNAYMHRKVKRLNGIALSALLLEKFIRELRKI